MIRQSAEEFSTTLPERTLRLIYALCAAGILATGCGGAARDVHGTTTDGAALPPAEPWPADGLPGLIPDLEAILSKPAAPLSEQQRIAAMFRLAALYDQRARTPESTEDLREGLRPSIRLYKSIIRWFPYSTE